MRAWRNWQTRMVEGHVPTRSGGSNPLARTLHSFCDRHDFHHLWRFFLFLFVAPACVAALLLAGDQRSRAFAQEIPHPPELPVAMEATDDRIVVSIAGERFTEYRHTGLQRPILFPLFAAGELPVTRQFPLVEGVPGESADHPHHQSVWFAHGDVNGLDYWSGLARIRHEKAEIQGNSILSTQSWLDGEKLVCHEETMISFHATEKWRLIDFRAILRAGESPVTFGDTKEGTFAMRTHPMLQIKGDDGSIRATAFNSEGISGVDIWGKRARWVHYEGTIENRTVGITMMDAPSNLRHPNFWHARDYGLIAANPFGLHELGGLPAGAGNITLAPGQSLNLRYGIVIWNGAADETSINGLFAEFSKD